MPVQSTVAKVALPPQTYPVLRQLSTRVRKATKDPLVVLFTSEDRGIPLSGVEPERIGVPEIWAPCSDVAWIPCSITLTSNP